MTLDISKIEPISNEPFEFGPIQTKWLEALESGEYKQAQSFLYDYERDSYCCLGVLCKLADLEFKPNPHTHKMQSGYGFVHGTHATNGYMPQGFHEVVGLRDQTGVFKRMIQLSAEGRFVASLAHCNDEWNFSFPEIAAIIRRDPHNVFTKAA